MAAHGSSRKASPAERIVKAAIQLFARRGFAGTTTRMIATKARVNEAIIFRHFPTKRDLYAAIIQVKTAADPIFAGLDPDELLSQNHEAILRLFAERILSSVQNDPSFVRLLYFSGLEGHELASMFFERYVSSLHQLLTDRFAAGMRKGEFRKVDPYLAARAFIGMVAHYALTNEIFGTAVKPLPSTEIVETFLTIFLRGLGGKAEG